MARLREKHHHLLPGVRLIGDRYHYQATRKTADGKRQSAVLGVVGDEDGMRRKWAELHPHKRAFIQPVPISIDGEMVYFVQIGRAVKIGYTSSRSSLSQRIDTFQTSSPRPVRVLGAVPGRRQDEKRAHRSLAKFSLSGEWFSRNAEVSAYISQALALGKIPDASVDVL